MFPSDVDIWAGVSDEKTPSMHEETVENPPGVYNNCYICGIEASRLPQNAIISIAYTPTPTKQEIRERILLKKYVLTYCARCYQSHIG